MKYSRLILGIAVLAACLWVLIGEQMTGASADAVVNAQVSVVRTETAGRVTLAPRTLGSRVSHDEVLGSVTDPLADDMRLADLLMERAFTDAEAERLGSELSGIRAIKAALDARTRLYRRERLADLRVRLDHARARLGGMEVAGLPREVASNVTDALGLAFPDGLPVVEDLALDTARERVATLEIAVRAAENDVFLGDGYNDAPNSEQRVVELEGEIALRQSGLAHATARAAALDARIARERVRVNRLGGGELRSPADGLYWQVMAADGTAIQRGDPVLRIVDCGTTLVTASVSETAYTRIEVGQPARFRLNGVEQAFEATVLRKAGSGAETVYGSLAVAPSQRHLERFDVLLAVPGLDMADYDGCAIGQTGRVFFEARPLDRLRAMLD